MFDPLTATAAGAYNTANNRLNLAVTTAYTDGVGNQTKAGSVALEYDVENRVSGATMPGMAAIGYLYDGDGRRVKKTVGNDETTFVYDGFGNLGAEMTTGVPNGPSGVTYVSGDHLGSTRVTTDSAGVVRNYFDYTPFGEEIGAGINSRPSATYAVNTYPAGTAVGPSQKFTGKERDVETGLDYFGARYMSAAMGRFSSPDPSSKGIALGDPQSWNLYSYTRNRPLTNIDVNGNWSQPVHHDLVRFRLSGLLSAGEIEYLVQRQVAMDKDQSAGGSIKHAMGQPREASAATVDRMWRFVAGNMGVANADAARNGNLSQAGLMALGDAIHTVQDLTSPMHMTDSGVPIVWRGLARENFSGLAHMSGEDFASDSWARFGQAVRLTLAAFLQASPQQAGRAGLTAGNLNRIADQRISQYVEHFYRSIMPGRNGRSEAEVDAARQCALGNPAACK